MDINDLRGWISVAVFLCFLGICWWAYRRSNKARFEHDALLPFEGENRPPRTAGGDEK